MKPSNLFLLASLFCSISIKAAQKYWVGPQNGDWSNSANWSDMRNGPGGSAVPGVEDSVIFNISNPQDYISLVHLDLSPTIGALIIQGKVTLYTSIPVELRILNLLQIIPGTLKDSTSTDVTFNLILNGTTRAHGILAGNWIFEGGVPLANAEKSGAMFTAEQGSEFIIDGTIFTSRAQIVFKKNSGHLVSNESSLRFLNNSNYILDGNLDAIIPAASWTPDPIPSLSAGRGWVAASIIITGTIEKLKFTQPILYCARLVLDLPYLDSNKSLEIPDGSLVDGNLEIYNTNNHTLTLLATTSNSSSVGVTVGNAGNKFSGFLIIRGDSTKVALATATYETRANSYKLLVRSFSQFGGNFSLQDYNEATGSTMLEISNSLQQTGGTLYTNSTSTDARFTILMGRPNTTIYGPSGIFSSHTSISMSSGTIDNATHKIILRIDLGANLYDINFGNSGIGVSLQTPLSVGRLELISTPLTTSITNILTINDPSPDAITMAGPSTCCVTIPSLGNTSVTYINGPVRRATNSTEPYLFPTGYGNSNSRFPIGYKFRSDSCYIVPNSSEPSMYQVEYFPAGYPDINVLAPLKGISSAEYWNIFKISGVDANVQLFLNEPVPGATAGDALVTANYVDGRWVAANETILIPGNAATGSVKSKPLANLGLLTFGYGDPAKLQPANNIVFNGLNYKYYEGGFDLLPDFNTLNPLKTGNSNSFNLDVRTPGVNDSFAIVWEGYINIPVPGTYTFETLSDDGSKLYFNSLYTSTGVPLISNDGTRPSQSATGTVDIPAAGRYPFTVAYMENYGDQLLEVYWTGPGTPRQLIPDIAFTDQKTTLVQSGLNYKYYEGVFDMLPDFTQLIPVKTGISPNIDISIRPGGSDFFGILWEGIIDIPVTGTYTFETNSDDGSKLYFNGSILVNNDGLHSPELESGVVTIAAGKYPISISFFEKDGGEIMEVYWSGPGIPRQRIPNVAFGTGSVATSPQGKGLNYKYYEGDFNILPDFSTLIPVKTGKTANVDISARPSGVNNFFAFLWEGLINIPTAGSYTFETFSDDGSKVYFNTPYSVSTNGVVNNDGLHGPNTVTGSVTVPTAGWYPIAITYFEKDGDEVMQLFWSGPGINRQLVPDTAFATTNAEGSMLVRSTTQTGNLASGLVNETAAFAKGYPNPFTESFIIEYFNTGSLKNKVNIELYNLNGRLIYTYQPPGVLPGFNKWIINLGSTHLAYGVYLARLNINGVLAKTVKLMKMK